MLIRKTPGPAGIDFRPSAECLRSMPGFRRAARRAATIISLIAALSAATGVLQAAPANISFSQSAASIDAYNFVEVTVHVTSPDVRNPFTEASVTGQFAAAGQAPTHVQGFCDSEDGSVFRIRFMPTKPGEYTYTVTYQQGDFTKSHQGNFPRDRRAPERDSSGRPEIPLAFYLGRDGAALFLERHNSVPDDGLEGRQRDSRHH